MPKETRICKRARRIALAFHTLRNKDDNRRRVLDASLTFCKRVADGAIPEKRWPGRMLSWDEMVTLLAVLHDACLPDSTPLLELTRTLGAARANEDEINRALSLADSWCFPALRGNSKRLDAIEAYLDDVRTGFERAPMTEARLRVIMSPPAAPKDSPAESRPSTPLAALPFPPLSFMSQQQAKRPDTADGKKAAKSGTADLPPRGKARRRNVRPPTEQQGQIAIFYENRTLNQTEVAKYLTQKLPDLKKPIGQSTVSRAIAAVNRWRNANPDLHLPQIRTRKRKVAHAVDPDVIDMGARTDHRAKCLRERPQQRRKESDE